MAEFEIFIKVLVAIAAGIVAIGGAYTFIEHLIDKASMKSHQVEDRVAEHERAIEKHAEYLDNDNRRLKDVEDTNRLIMRGIMNLLSHEIDGNHTSQLEEVRDDMNKYLMNK